LTYRPLRFFWLLASAPLAAGIILGIRWMVLSFGAARRFRMRHRRRRDLTLELELGDGSLLLMHGATQHHWVHALPKTARPVGERINLTFRRILPA
jgi:hypothetical protein